MTTALGPADVLCRLLTTLYFSLFSFFCITVIWLYDLHVAPNGVNCKVNCSNRLEFEILIEMTGCDFTCASHSSC